MAVWATDWTHWQGKPLPAKQVADEGFGLVKLKVGGASKEGWSFIDPTFLESAQALLAEPRLIPGAYWYLMPGNPHAQAGLLLDTLRLTGSAFEFAVYVDVEQPGLTWYDFAYFAQAWQSMTLEKPLSIYTSKRFWLNNMTDSENVGSEMCPVLEEAHWVPEAVRKDPARPYASQQAKEIQASWWTDSYAGWTPAGIQFTDNALIAGKRNVAAKYPGTVQQLRSRLI